MGNLGNKEIMAKNIRHYMEKYNRLGKWKFLSPH